MQVAATDPMAVSPEEIDTAVIEKEKEIATEQLKAEGKPEAMIEKILEGKMNKFKNEHALLTQEFIKDPEKKIQDLMSEAVAKLGENIQIGRFRRIEIGKE
jgi:elongation factor Ts